MSGLSPAALMPLAVVLPISGAVLAPLLARISVRAPLVVSLVAMAGSTAVLGLLAPSVFDGRVVVHYLGGWEPVHGAALGVTFAADPFGLTYALLCSVVGGLLLLYTLSELGDMGAREIGGYAALFQLLLAALVASALTADLLNLFVWFEVAALASYGLTGFFLERPLALEAAFKIMVLTNIAAFLVFVAVAMVYAGHGALNFGQVQQALATHLRTADLVALALLVAGFGVKAGLMPFHGWLADAHTAAPGPVSALFSGLMVNLGVVAIARFAYELYVADRGALLGLLTVLGCVSAIAGAALALAQDDLKRVLAYDTVSQMGVLLVAVGAGTSEALAGMVYHLVDHALFKTLLFLCAGAIVHATGMTKLSEMGGLARQRPVLTAAFVVGVLAISGVPPLNGYVSIGLIHHALEAEHPVQLAALVVAQVVTIAALGRATYLAFFRRRHDEYDTLERLRPGMLVALSALGLGCVAFGALPNQVLSHVVAPAAAALEHGHDYAAATLSGGGRLPVAEVPFEYFSPSTIGVMLGTVLLGTLLARWYVRREREPRPVTWLRAVHTGSVNDYAAYAAFGTVVAVLVLLL
jgi:multicomponent Na+:H+ antiporter subunit D